MSTLEGHTVFITGSSRGIGAAAARLAASQGAKVIIHGRSHGDSLSQLADELDAAVVVFNVANRDAVHAAADELFGTFSKIDALINCAGWVNIKPFEELTEEDWLREFRVNLFGMGYVCQAILPKMREAGYGRVVNVGSLRSLQQLAAPRGVAYSTSKAAVLSMTTALAKEYAPQVNVNAVCPGFIETEMSHSWDDAVWQKARSALVGRVGTSEEVAELLVFLASKKSSFITGQTIVIDGGYSVAGK